MALMKKHPLLKVDFLATVRWSAQDQKHLLRWLDLSGEVLADLTRRGLLPSAALKDLKVIHVSLLLCGDARMRRLNRDFRKKDKVTDVLSFPSHGNLRSSTSSGEEIFLGDLAICHPQILRQANEFSIGYWDEFVHLFFHGLFHLLGYDHEASRKEELVMQEWEDRAIELLGKKKGARRPPR